MKVLITGGAGFIGRATSEELVSGGHDVVVLDSLSEQIHGVGASDPDLPLGVQFVRGDVRDSACVSSLVRDCDAVIHLAAETGTGQSMYEINRYCDVNVQGTAVLLQALTDEPNRVRRLLIASSRSVYGEGRYRCEQHGAVDPGARDPAALESGRFDPECPQCGISLTSIPTPEEAALDTASIYAVTKLAQEKLVLAYANARRLTAFALRYQNVWGEGQSLSNAYTGILSIFSTLMLENRPIEIFEDGDESRAFVHVRDVARVNSLLITSDTQGCHTLNVGSGMQTSVREVVAKLAQAYGYTAEPAISGRFRAGDIRHNYADLARLHALLPDFAPMPFEQGIEAFAAWVRKLGDGPGNAGERYDQSLNELERQGLMGRAGSAD